MKKKRERFGSSGMPIEKTKNCFQNICLHCVFCGNIDKTLELIISFRTQTLQ